MLYAEVFRELADAQVQYAVTGGIALVLHGVVRFTADLDLIVELSEDNLSRFLRVMDKLGYQPKQPVPAQDLCNPDMRRSWAEEKNMIVFTFCHPASPLKIIDVFISEPIPFPDLASELVWFDAGEARIPVVSKNHLKQLKRISSRPQDNADIDILEELERKEKGA